MNHKPLGKLEQLLMEDHLVQRVFAQKKVFSQLLVGLMEDLRYLEQEATLEEEVILMEVP